jgi:hypothetical protein
MKLKQECCSAGEAAIILDLPVDRVRSLVRAGILRGGRPGGRGHYRISIRSIRNYLRGRSE